MTCGPSAKPSRGGAITTIAWDGRFLAADKQSTSGGFGRKTTKVHRVPDGLIASTGATAACVAMREWFDNGMHRKEWPQIQGTEKDCVTFYVDWAGQLWIYEDHPHPIKVENPFDAVGTGRDYALAAMFLGLSAAEAVEIASIFDINSGNGWDALNLEECRPKD